MLKIEVWVLLLGGVPVPVFVGRGGCAVSAKPEASRECDVRWSSLFVLYCRRGSVSGRRLECVSRVVCS